MKRTDPETPFPLGPELEFLRRLWRLGHALEQLSSRMEGTLGVTAQQRLIIRCVGRFPGISAGQLAALLHVDPGTVSSSLARLARKGLVERRRDPADGRRAALGLTRKGRALDVPTTGTVEAAVSELLAAITPSEAAATLAVLERFTALLAVRSAR